MGNATENRTYQDHTRNPSESNDELAARQAYRTAKQSRERDG